MNINTFNSLTKGDIVYILSLDDFSVKKSEVVEIDREGIFTHYKDFTFDKFNSKLDKSVIKDKKEYCSPSLQEIKNELLFLRDRNENDMNDNGFILGFYKTHENDNDVSVEQINQYYINAKRNLDLIKSSLETL